MTLATLSRVVSPYVGLVPRLDTCLAGPDDTLLPTCVCSLSSDPRVLGDGLAHVGLTSGSGRSREEAAAAAIGEAVERYSATYVPHDRLVEASAAELGGDAVDPARFALFDESQHRAGGFPFRRFDAATRVLWVGGRALGDGRPAWLPAELVFLGDVVSENRIGYATSSGMACADTRDEATVRGLYELVERDAFMLTWRNRLSLPQLVWRGHAKLRTLDDRYFAPTGLRYAAVDLSCIHGVPSVLGVVRSPSGDSGPLGVGAGTASTVGRAWWKALGEAFAAYASARRMESIEPGRPLPPDDVRSFDDHIRYYATAERAVAAEFLDASCERVDVRDVPSLDGDVGAQIRMLLDRIQRAGSSAYAVDVTSPDVRALGFQVVKTVAPELCGLDVFHRARFLGGGRVLRAAFELGLLPRPLVVEELNPDPHPFP